jgi:nitroimidazol reductase NimA-like FMN-containing flavoprotein (pyridoxamine 5'-phosphate oxidase superfamily)
MTVRFDADGVEILTAHECVRLLATRPVGRLVFHEEGLPAVRLVNFVVDDGNVVFRTGGGQTYAVAVRGDVVAFEVDDYDVDTHLGWTVTAVGRARLVAEPADAARPVTPRPWASGDRRHVVAVDIATIDGRRLVPWGKRPRS